MNGTHRRRRWSGRSCMAFVALVLFLVAVRRAHVSLDHLTQQTLDTPTSFMRDARPKEPGDTALR